MVSRVAGSTVVKALGPFLEEKVAAMVAPGEGGWTSRFCIRGRWWRWLWYGLSGATEVTGCLAEGRVGAMEEVDLSLRRLGLVVPSLPQPFADARRSYARPWSTSQSLEQASGALQMRMRA